MRTFTNRKEFPDKESAENEESTVFEFIFGLLAVHLQVIAEHAYYCGFTQRGTAVIASCAQSSNAELLTYMWSTLRQTDGQQKTQSVGQPAKSSKNSDSSSEEDDDDD